MPFFSVVIPLFNKEKYIRQCIESILNQNFDDFEIIIINDGSTDRSAEIVNSIKDSRLKLISKKNQGVAAARNRGIEESGGEIIAFLDADDFWYPNHLTELYKLSQKFPKVLLYATAYEIEYHSRLIKTYSLKTKENFNLLFPYYKYAKAWPLFYTSNFALAKSLFKTEKAFKNHLHGEDTELFLRLGHKYPLAYSSTVSMRHIDNADNSLSTNYKTDKKVLILDELKIAEEKDAHLKKILDLNRFSWVLEYKMKGEKHKANVLKDEILKKNLNFTQRLLMKFPASSLVFLKRAQNLLKKRNVYLTPYK